jgi:hypothetical protein
MGVGKEANVSHGTGLWRSRFIYIFNMQFWSINLISFSASNNKINRRLGYLTIGFTVRIVQCVNIFAHKKYDEPEAES